MPDGGTVVASYKMKLSSSVVTQVPQLIIQTPHIWMIFGRSIQSPWNGTRSKLLAMHHHLALIALSTTISKIIESSYLEEAGPIRSGTTQSTSLIGKVKNGRNCHQNKINPPLGRELTIRLNYSRTISSPSEEKVWQIWTIFGYSTSKLRDGVRSTYPRLCRGRVQDGFIPQL